MTACHPQFRRSMSGEGHPARDPHNPVPAGHSASPLRNHPVLSGGLALSCVRMRLR